MSDKSSGKRDKMSAIVDWREEIIRIRRAADLLRRLD